MSNEITSQGTCSICKNTIAGRRVEWAAYAASGNFRAKEITGYVCKNCGKEICLECQPKHVKPNMMTGWATTTCPQCSELFGPGQARLSTQIQQATTQIPKTPPPTDVRLDNVTETRKKAMKNGLWGLILIIIGGGVLLAIGPGSFIGIEALIVLIPIGILLSGGSILVRTISAFADLPAPPRLVTCKSCNEIFQLNNRWLHYYCQSCGRELFLNLMSKKVFTEHVDQWAACGVCHAPNPILNRKVWSTCPKCKQKVELNVLGQYI